MKTIKFLTSITAIGIAVAFYSCKGDTGPAGPTGSNGTNGNANVQVTPFQINSSQWVTNANYSWEIDGSFTTTGINFSGAILCYYSADGVTNWALLPWTSVGNQPYYEQICTFNASTGAFNIAWTNITPGSTSPPTPPATSYFKIVAVPPSIIKQHPNTNFGNSAEVAQLPEVQAALNKN